jgi:hypothetical protein
MTFLGIAALAALFAWLCGGVLLRLGGLALVLTGAIGMASSGDADGALIAALGAALWLLGHGHYALRHREFRSLLAECVFLRLDPVRGHAGQPGAAGALGMRRHHVDSFEADRG